MNRARRWAMQPMAAPGVHPDDRGGMHKASPEGPKNFLDEVIARTPGGERLRLCLQCGTCGGSCPSGPDMDHTPRDIFAMIVAGKRDEVLKSNTFWYCVPCYYCTVRCPQHI